MTFVCNQGKISADDIKCVAKELGENFTDREINDMIDEADRDSELTYFSVCSALNDVLPFKIIFHLLFHLVFCNYIFPI